MQGKKEKSPSITSNIAKINTSFQRIITRIVPAARKKREAVCSLVRREIYNELSILEIYINN
jgi:hypothetical protein